MKLEKKNICIHTRTEITFERKVKTCAAIFTPFLMFLELDVVIGDTYPEIVAHETRIMMKLTTTILENLHTLSAAVEKCAELDWYDKIN